MKTKAAILRQIGLDQPYAETQPLSVEEITLLDPAPTDLIVRVEGAGLCHSDLSVINGARPRPVPMAMGHEGAGVIEEVGSAITDLKAGDPVVFQFSASCGRCRYCQSGRPQICEAARAATGKGELMSGGSRLRDADGEVIRHQAGLSCFSEYVVVNRGSVVKIDDSIRPEDAAVFGCAVMTGVGALLNTARIEPGQSVAIFGLGGVGLCGMLGAKAAGAGIIIAVDVDERKLDRARQLGATHAFLATDPELVSKVHDLTGGGVDVAAELAGSVKAMEGAYAVTVRGGRVVTAGLSPSGAKFAFDHGDLVTNEKAILGSYMGSCVPVRDIPRFLQMYRAGALPVDRLVDGKLGFDGINAGFDRLANGEAVRQVLTPHA